MHCQLTARSVQFVAFQLLSRGSVILLVTNLVRLDHLVFSCDNKHALRHGVAAFLRGEILDVRHWGAMVAPFNASSGAIREACADAEQMNCIGKMVVNPTGTKAKFMLPFISGGGI